MGFARQTWTLTKKNLRITVKRHWLSTIIRAFLLPIIFVFFISYIKNFFVPPSNFGIGSPVRIRSFIDALRTSTGGRDTVAFVDNGHKGGEIEALIKYLTVSIRAAGKTVTVLDDDDQLLTTCRSSLRGVSTCFGAASFRSSPTEGGDGIWNYTLRSDGALNTKIYVDKHDNDAEIYVLPFQHAIDAAIVNEFGNATANGAIPDVVDEYPFTNKDDKQRADDIRRLFMTAIQNFLGVVFFLGLVGILYHLTGFMASERELGMSQLIEAMTPNKHQWHTQAARLLANHLAFDIVYFPSWLVTGLILKNVVYTQTSYGILIIFQILSGLALSSLSILGASLFRKSQLSGITVVIISIVLAIITQVTGKHASGASIFMGLLFTPMNYTLQIAYFARFEGQGQATNLAKKAPGSASNLPGYAFWIFLIIQIIVYPIVGALIERSLYGTASKVRKITYNGLDSALAIKISSFSKHYVPSFWKRRVSPIFGGEKVGTVVAVNNLSLDVLRGQILVLLGANGSGKSTTLDAIAGLGTVTEGSIEIDGTGGLGLCPQRNVLWNELTVFEHVAIFDGLKSSGPVSKTQIEELVRACDLGHKMHAKAKTLSGGQKRKLQLACMFVGGSRVCCIDEVSSGLDPLSRRKIWDILLRERGSRTLLFTTHFLDEADVLSDHIAILSKGSLKADGSAVELKHKLGRGYHVDIHSIPDDKANNIAVPEEISSVDSSTTLPPKTQYLYEDIDPSEISASLNQLELQGITDYTVREPSIEDVFLRIAEEARDDDEAHTPLVTPVSAPPAKSAQSSLTKEDSGSSYTEAKVAAQDLDLSTGKGTTILQQAWILFRKRVTVFKRNWIPYLCLVIIPIAAAGLITIFFKNFKALSCSPEDQNATPEMLDIQSLVRLDIPVGPRSRISETALENLVRGANASAFQVVDSFDEFNGYISRRYQNVTPGGIYLGTEGETPTMAYIGNYVMQWALLTQNILNQLLGGVPISTQFQVFAVPFAPGAGKSLQAIFYFGLAMSVYPGFFVLYPTVERLRKVRALHYSNGIRAAPLWLAYAAFDFMFVLLVSALAIILLISLTSIWYYPSYLFVVFFLFGLTSILFSYVVSLFVSSQLAAFAWAAGIQAVLFLCYFVSYLSILTYSPAYNIDRDLLIAHFTIALVTPAGNLLRALLLTLNEFSILCDDDGNKASYPGAITVYGGPILYLLIQAALLFVFLVWYDSGYKPAFLSRTKKSKKDTEDVSDTEGAIATLATDSSKISGKSGLHVQHLCKSFGSVQAVEDVTFTVPTSSVFALLGPNGAGKSTTISLIRGDIRPDHNGGDVQVENISITKHRAEARRHLGVCPQFDAMDSMTVLEHLNFYARARGVPNVNHNVTAAITAVGLDPYRDRLAQNLSGGNKRKLSLAIALMGNPDVLLLDEPSSGMDAASKRVMWRTLENVTKGRGMLITTHSMEEADKLATNVGIMATRMLALGTSDTLRKQFGAKWYVHLVLSGAPHVPEAETLRVKAWLEDNVADVDVEERMWYGQLRFSVPSEGEGRSVAKLFALLEGSRQELGLEYYSVSRTTLDQVFLEVVGRHDVEEEGEGRRATKKVGKKRVRNRWRRMWDDA
ncbi:ATP-binding cassette sub-family A member 7 [Tothia fuscella]|uniref:ATP-binding cassette sub-family A member 7 n=1 Tax=Tothia fuscella TaxID=1048955 RepID=A0A9P4P030_9PEZI|nr:ATP-binding cassette sub-family A member 7 [Tothia fuscella]